MVAFSAFQVLMYHYTRQCDQILGCVTSTRKQFGTDALLGLFINMIPIRSAFSPDTNFPALVRQIRETTLSALEHELPFDVLVRRRGRRVPSMTPLFQVVFVFEPSIAPASEEWQLEDQSGDDQFAKWDLALFVQENRGHLSGRFTYYLDIFDSETIVAMRNTWVSLLGELASDPDRSLDKLFSLSSQNRDNSFPRRWFDKYFRRSGGPSAG